MINLTTKSYRQLKEIVNGWTSKKVKKTDRILAILEMLRRDVRALTPKTERADAQENRASVKQWITDCTEPHETEYVEAVVAYQHYIAYCRKHAYHSVYAGDFYKLLKDFGIEITFSLITEQSLKNDVIRYLKLKEISDV